MPTTYEYMKRMSTIGFDIGNENCYIAAIKYGFIEILDNEYNLHSTPSYIGFTEKSRDIGITPKTRIALNMENTISGFKRLLGRNFNDLDLEEELVFLPYEICKLRSGCIGVNVNYLSTNVLFSVNQLMAMMLTKLKMTAEYHLNNEIGECVISVPVFYSDAERRAMLDSAKIAGLNVLKLMNESTAVALAYGFYNLQSPDEKSQNVIFVDLGHASLTVTACNFTKERLKILGCVSDHVGGRDFDKVLVKYFEEDFKDRYSFDIMTCRKALIKLFLECESVKKAMSTNTDDFNFHLDCFVKDLNIWGRINREIFENISMPVLDRIEKTLQKVLEYTGLKSEDIHSVQIVGGSSRVPSVKVLVQKVFGREPCMALNQDEAVAIGCSIQCAILSRSIETSGFAIDESPPYTVKIMWKNKESEYEEVTVFSRYDTLPAIKIIIFPVVETLYLEVNGYNPIIPVKVHKIGCFTITNIPQVTDSRFSKITVEVSLDVHCIFSIVSAKLVECSSCNLDYVHEFENEEGAAKIDTSTNQGPDMNLKKGEDIDKLNIINKSYDLTVNSEVPVLSDRELQECIDIENQMIDTFLKEKENDDARNYLELYIYDVIGKLNSELSGFVVEKEKAILLEYLHEVGDWLYEIDEQESCDYIKRLHEIQNELEPINKRFLEWSQRPVVIKEFLQALQEVQAFIDVLKCEKELEDTNKKEIEILSEIRQRYEDYFNGAIKIFSKLEKHSDFNLTVDEIRNVLNDFKTDLQKYSSVLLRNANNTKELNE